MTSLAFKGRRALLLIGVVALWASNFQPAHAGGGFARGGVAAGVGNGLIRVFDANGNLLVTLDNTTGSYQQTGMCFDPNGDFYSTDFGTSQMSKFDGGGTLVQASWGGPFGGSQRTAWGRRAGRAGLARSSVQTSFGIGRRAAHS